LGYEDVYDHEQLRKDPVIGILEGRNELEEPLAGKSTLDKIYKHKHRGQNQSGLPAFHSVSERFRASRPSGYREH